MPARPPGRTPGPRLAGRPRRCSAGESEPGSPACRLAPRPPARSRSRSRCAASSSPSLFSFSFASSGAEVGKPAPAAGDHRELKQETPSQGENPGGVERGEGSRWNLSGSTEAPVPPPLAPLPFPGAARPGDPGLRSRSPSPVQESASPLGNTLSSQQ